MKLQHLGDTEMYRMVSTPREIRKIYAWVAVSITLWSAFLAVDSVIQKMILNGMYA